MISVIRFIQFISVGVGEANWVFMYHYHGCFEKKTFNYKFFFYLLSVQLYNV